MGCAGLARRPHLRPAAARVPRGTHILQLVGCPAVFCAFAHWMDAQAGLAPGEKRAIAARILPIIRFTSMRPATVATYWHAYDWFRCVAGGQVLMARQLSCMCIVVPHARSLQLGRSLHFAGLVQGF